MSKMKSEWKNYIREAKSRLNENYYNILDGKTFFLNGKRLSHQQLVEFNKVVADVAASEDFVSDPLGRLVERDVYNTLSDQQKLKYIFELSKIYLELKSKYN